MNKENKNPPEAALLRLKAEDQIKRKQFARTSSQSNGDEPNRTEADTLKLLYELEVHQIELEMQNEELQRALDKAEQAAIQYADLYEEIYDFSPAGYFTLDRDGIICELNLSGARMLGKERSVLANKDFKLFVTCDTLPAFNNFLQKGFETYSKQTCEIGLTIKEKLSVFVHLEGRISENEQKFLITAIDITERNKAVKALLESEPQFSEIIDFLPDATFAIDRGGKVIAWNLSIEEMTGVMAEKILGKGDYEYALPFYGVRIPILIDLVFITDKEIEKKYHFVKKEGNILLAEADVHKKGGGSLVLWIKVAPLYDSMGNIVGAIEAIRDITERKAAADSLTRLNDLYLVVSQINSLIIHVRDKQILFNEACRIAVQDGHMKMAWIGLVNKTTHFVEPAAYFGDEEGYLDNIKISIDDIPEGNGPTGKSLRDKINYICNDIENDPQVLPWRSEMIRRGYHSSASFSLIVNDQAIDALNLYAQTAHFFNPEQAKLLEGIAENISFAIMNMQIDNERLQAAEEIKRINAELEQRVCERTLQLESINKELESFSYSVSHDLRAPLRSIDGFSNLLLNNYSNLLDEQGKDYFQRIMNGSKKMGLLIDNLLDLSRYTRVEIKYEITNLSSIAESITEELKASDPERKVNFFIQPEIIVNADRNLIEIVLQNLIANAWKYSSNKPVAKIEFGSMKKGRRTVYYVRDNGDGFDMRYVDKLFGAFQRLHTNAEFEGIGIGLATVSRIIHRHGGTISAEGTVNSGATFYFTL